MNQPSEEAKSLASWLIEYQREFVHLLDDSGFYMDAERLAEVIDEYFSSRR